MKLSHHTQLLGKKHFCGFRSNFGFTPSFQTELSFETFNLNALVNLRCSIDFYYNLTNGVKERQRIHFTKVDLCDGVYNCSINSGDLINKVIISLYYEFSSRAVIDLNVSLTECLNQKNDGNFEQLINYLKRDELVNFVQELRSFLPHNFVLLLTRDLPTLEASIDKGSQQVFKKWAIADQIIRLAGTSKILLNCLDWAAEKYSNQYSLTKNNLGIEEIRL